MSAAAAELGGRLVVAAEPGQQVAADAEFPAWFRSDEDWLGDLEGLRWPGGFAGRYCGHPGGRLADGRI